MSYKFFTIAFALALSVSPVFAQQTAYIPVPPKPLTVREKVELEFKDAPIMVRIADAESDFRPDQTNKNSSASGVFQILRGTWKDYKCEGDFETERFDADANIACARKIYNRSGTTPWNPSKHDWGRYL